MGIFASWVHTLGHAWNAFQCKISLRKFIYIRATDVEHTATSLCSSVALVKVMDDVLFGERGLGLTGHIG